MSYEAQLEMFREESFSRLDRLLRSEEKEILDFSSDKEETDRIVNDIEKVSRWIRLPQLLDREVVPAVLRQARGGKIRVVETCCGNGWYLRHLARRVSDLGLNAELIGLDASPGSIDTARAAATAFDIQWVVGDATCLPYEVGEIDVVINIQSLHHFPPSMCISLLRESQRVAKEIFYFDLRRTYFGFLLVRLLRPIASWEFIHDASLSHRRAYRVEELRYLCAQAGLDLTIGKLSPIGLMLRTPVEESGS